VYRGSDPGIFKKDSSFTIAIHPRIKHENPRRRFELSECFLILAVSEIIGEQSEGFDCR